MNRATQTEDRHRIASARWLSLSVLSAGFLLIVVDATIVNVALPSIQRDLGFEQPALAWVVNAYIIAFAGLLLLAGQLGDLVGRKRIFVIGLVIFIAASGLCGLSFTQPMLIAARTLQGIGGAASTAVTLGIIVTTFPEPREQARAISAFGFAASVGFAGGMLAGGLITEAISWHWIFIVNLPIGLITVLCALRFIESDGGAGLRSGADVAGAVLIAAGLIVAVYTTVQSAEPGWASVHIFASGVLMLVLLGSFILRQHTARSPLLPLRIVRSRVVAGANVIQATVTAAFVGVFFLGSLDFERVLGYGPMSIGLAFLPVGLATGVISLKFSPRLITHLGPRMVLLAGQMVIALGLTLLAVSPSAGGYLSDLFVPMILLGAGSGLLYPSLAILAMSGFEPSAAGVASGLLSTSGQVGGALGLALLSTVASSRTGQLVATGRTTAATALAAGYHFAWAVGAVIVVVSAAVALHMPKMPDATHAPQPREEVDPGRIITTQRSRTPAYVSARPSAYEGAHNAAAAGGESRPW